MTTTTFPNGETLTSSALTPNAIFAIFQPLITGCLGIQPSDLLAQTTVRKAWQTAGAPAFSITDNIVTLEFFEIDNEYNKVRDVSYTGNDATSLTRTFNYTRVWRCMLISRGPASYDNLRLIKSALLLDWAHDTLAANQLYVVPAFGVNNRMPELSNGQWWERSDFSFTIYEGITETTIVNQVASLEVKVYDAVGLQLDIELGD